MQAHALGLSEFQLIANPFRRNARSREKFASPAAAQQASARGPATRYLPGFFNGLTARDGRIILRRKRKAGRGEHS